MKDSLFVPMLDNGMGLSRTKFAAAMFTAAVAGVFAGRKVITGALGYPYPDGAMNIATNDFMASDCEAMLVVDTDVIPRVEHLRYLLSHNVPLVFGMYPVKAPGLTYPIVPLEGNPCPFEVFGDDYLCEVACCARGLMLVRRSVFEMLGLHCRDFHDSQSGAKMVEYWKNEAGGHSEDFNFCKRYRELGGRVMVDIRATAQHEGSIVYPIPGTWDDKTGAQLVKQP